MNKFLLAISIFLFPVFAQAQQIDNTEFMQKAIAFLQQQRNNALDALTASEARNAIFADLLAKANTKIKELEDKAKPKDEPPVKK